MSLKPRELQSQSKNQDIVSSFLCYHYSVQSRCSDGGHNDVSFRRSHAEGHWSAAAEWICPPLIWWNITAFTSRSSRKCCVDIFPRGNVTSVMNRLHFDIYDLEWSIAARKMLNVKLVCHLSAAFVVVSTNGCSVKKKTVEMSWRTVDSYFSSVDY